MKHTPHEIRHTFITQAKSCHVNEYILKKIIGHEIRDITEKVYTHRRVERWNCQNQVLILALFIGEKYDFVSHCKNR